jgi:hypothetical protein
MPFRPNECRDCKKPLRGRGVYCKACKAFQKRMRAIHGSNHDERYVRFKAAFVEHYKMIVANGGRLFEGSK